MSFAITNGSEYFMFTSAGKDPATGLSPVVAHFGPVEKASRFDTQARADAALATLKTAHPDDFKAGAVEEVD